MTETITAQEILSQPRVIRHLLDEEAGPIARLAASLVGKFQYVMIAARGTSDNAARYGQYVFGAHNHLPVALATPSLFTLYGQPPRLEGALVIGISQSGQSPDILEVIRAGRRAGRPTVAITNDPTSPLAEAAEYTIQLHAGQEQAVAATKTYTGSLAALALLSAQLDGQRAERLAELQRVPDLMEQTLAGLEPLRARIERYRYMSHCTVIGRGYNYATAFEIALKTKELTRVVAESYSSADFRHGPIAMVSEGFPVLVIAPTSQVSGDIEDLLDELVDYRPELLIISDQPALFQRAKLAFPIPGDVPEWLTPLVTVLPGQLFALELALARGFDPDHPRGLHKVTETL